MELTRVSFAADQRAHCTATRGVFVEESRAVRCAKSRKCSSSMAVEVERKTRKITSRNTIQAGDRLILSATELLSFFCGFFEGCFFPRLIAKKKERIGSIGRVGRAANPVPKIQEAFYYYSSGRLFV